jgi:hypothetical protein
MAAELVGRLAIFVVICRFPCIGTTDPRSLRFDMYVLVDCNISFVDLLMFPFDAFGEVGGDNSCNVVLLFLMVLWFPIFAMLCRTAVPILWHASVSLGRRHVGFFNLFSFLIGGFRCFSSKKNVPKTTMASTINKGSEVNLSS